MSNQSGTLMLTVARAGAVVLALGALSYFVVTAQIDAQPSAAAPTDDELPYEESFGRSPLLDEDADDPTFMPSTKSAIGVGGGSGGAFRNRGGGQSPSPDEKPHKADSQTEKPVFLQSSKSLMRIGVDRSKEAIQKPAKKKPVFLPSSKSLPYEDIKPGGKSDR